MPHKPREYAVIDRNEGEWMNRLLVGTPVTGLVRAEWVRARYGQIIPTNWSMADAWQPVPTYCPMKYLVADAQNLIVKTAIEQDFEWVCFIEHDNVLPPNAFIILNEYMRKCTVPILSGLYFTRSVPPEPLIYRGRGTSFFADWKVGDLVWCDGIPMGTTLIHSSILKALWERSPEYNINGQVTRRVFSCPENAYNDPEDQSAYTIEVGTSDLAFCNRCIKEDIFKAAGWPEYHKKKYPFLVDTRLQVGHIEQDGRVFPIGGIPKEFLPVEKSKPKVVSKASVSKAVINKGAKRGSQQGLVGAAASADRDGSRKRTSRRKPASSRA